MTEALLRKLIDKYLSGQASSEEEKMLKDWYGDNLSNEIEIDFESEEERNLLFERMYDDIQNYAHDHNDSRKINYYRYYFFAAAASIVLLIGSYFLYNRYYIDFAKPNNKLVSGKYDVEPGHSGAILTLANGSTLVLDSANDGQLTAQGTATIVKQGAQIIYKNAGGAAAGLVYNTLTIPKGRRFKVVLPDGTLVWLNSASSLKYPTAFTGHDRSVELTGEGYFQVVHNALHPFRVKAGNAVIEDIGTSFDINAYSDEPTLKTTLITGCAKISAGKKSMILRPGDQAEKQSGGITITQVDTSQVLAWKSGFFQFDNADLETITRELSRWYNLQVFFDGSASPRKFFGRINSNMKLSEVLKMLQHSQVHFEIRPGNKLIVKP